MSFTASYPILNHLIVVVIEKIANIPIAVAFRIWSLVTVALTSIGLYFLSFRLTKNQTVSTLAAIFYLICPITWVFLLEWGFAAEQLSYLLVPPVFIFLCNFLDEYYLKGLNHKAKIYYLLLALGLIIISRAHLLVFVSVLMFSLLFFIVYPLINYKSKRINIRKIISATSVSFIGLFLLTLLSLYPFLRYQSIVRQGAPFHVGVENYQNYMRQAVYPLNVFGITNRIADYKSLDDVNQNLSTHGFRNVAFPFAISLLALVGLIGSPFLNRKIFAFGLANLIPLIIAVSPAWAYYFIKWPFADYYFNWRSVIIPSRFILPLMAAFGCYSLAYLVTFPIDLLSKRIKRGITKHVLKLVFVVAAGVLTLAVGFGLLWQFKNWPYKSNNIINYGPETSAGGRELDIRNIWKLEADYCAGAGAVEDKIRCSNITLQKYFWEGKLKKECEKVVRNKNLPPEITEFCGANPTSNVIIKIANICKEGKVEKSYSDICETRIKTIAEQLKPEVWRTVFNKKDLFGGGSQIFGPERDFLSVLPNNTNTRIDISTSHGGFMMVEPYYSQMPELPAYYNQGSLLNTMWNYEISVFNQEKSPWPQASIMYELSKYFGLEYMLMQESGMPLDRYAQADWDRYKSWEPSPEWASLWKFKEPVGLLRATTKPVVLVIGQEQVDSYFRIFHLANLGVLPFEEGLLVKGGSYVDTYTANDYKQFDAVIMDGYAFRSLNRNKGRELINEYVLNGGSLLVNTGWQYVSAGWQRKETPLYHPLTELNWQYPGKTDSYLLENTQFGKDVDISKFSPLVYRDEPWGISSSDTSNLRTWAKVILSAGGKPLIAGGQYGAGKVIWMGFDLPGHIGDYEDNEEEIKLYKNLVAYLLENKEGKVLAASYTRDYPDKLEITINESSDVKTAVYWSEAYYPDFKARLITNNISEKLKVYKAGPGMTMFILPKVVAGAKIIYEYKTPASIIVARAISILTFILIVAITAMPGILRKVKVGIVEILRQGKLVKKIKKELDEEFNY